MGVLVLSMYSIICSGKKVSKHITNSDVVDTIEVLVPFCIVHMLHMRSFNLQRIPLEEQLAGGPAITKFHFQNKTVLNAPQLKLKFFKLFYGPQLSMRD